LDRNVRRRRKMKLTKEQKKKLYIDMVRVRKLDELLVKALYAGKICLFFHSQQGQEAVGVGACAALREDDYIFTSHRGHGIGKALVRGMDVRRIVGEHYNKVTGCCLGLSAFHLAQKELGIPGHGSSLGGEFVLAAGFGIAAELRGKGQVVMCFQGDGTLARGPFHEAMVMASKRKLPVIYVIENNKYMVVSPVEELWPMENLADLALGYHVPGIVVDGQDVIAVNEAVQPLIDRARKGEGPSIIECKTYRYRSHAEGFNDLRINVPRPKEEINAWLERDPIKLLGERLLKEGILTQAEIKRIDLEATKEMEEADRLATEDPIQNNPEVLYKVLYAD
jgi:TPP-dependent pyruvate/acetoin dehydrogenase alpha subunit